jgi:hypothetical protein
MSRSDAFHSPSHSNRRFARKPIAIVLGTNEIASAIAVYLQRSGRSVILSHDPTIPVIRRGMAFYDALFGDFAWVDDVKAKRIDYIADIFKLFESQDQVAVSMMGVTDLMVIGGIDILVDARMDKRSIKPDLRGLAETAVGLGPGFKVHGNCDVAIETRPDQQGLVLRDGETKMQDRTISTALGGIGAERFVYAPTLGRWRTALDIGVRVFKGVVIGHIDGKPLTAPMDGVLRGLARDDCEVPAGVKIVEIDPRGRACRWSGMDERCQAIAEAVMQATRQHEAVRAFLGSKPSILMH